VGAITSHLPNLQGMQSPEALSRGSRACRKIKVEGEPCKGLSFDLDVPTVVV